MNGEQEPSAKQRAAYAAGRSAFAAGFDTTACPHDLTGEDPDGLGTLWTRGYADARMDAGAPFGTPIAPPAGVDLARREG